MQFRSQFCDCCHEERWVKKDYQTNDEGKKFCKRCMTSIRRPETPRFSASNNMVRIEYECLHVDAYMHYRWKHVCILNPMLVFI